MNKYITKHFWFFCAIATLLTIVFYGALYFLQTNTASNTTFLLTSVFYGLGMFASGWYFGKRNGMNADLFDSGVFIHLASYIIWGTVSITWMQILFTVPNFSPILNILFFWGIGLAAHIIPFIRNNNKKLSGYEPEEIFD